MQDFTPDDFAGPSELDEYLEFACDDAVADELLSRGEFGCSFVMRALKADEPMSLQMVAKFKLPAALVAYRGGDQSAALSDFVGIIKDLVEDGERG